jgi:tRNA(fMet)-specific endonuclease VapC
VIVADTDVLIDYLQGFDPCREMVRGEILRKSLATTAVSAYELWLGASGPRRAEGVRALLAFVDVLALDGAAAVFAADARRAVLAHGQDIGTADCLIAGICLARRLPLLTRNVRHFSRIPDLSLVPVVA